MKILLRTLLTLLSTCVLTQPAHASDSVARIKPRSQLVVGVAYVAPLYRAGQKYRTPENVNEEATQAMAKQLDLSVSTIVVTSQNRLSLLTSGNVDALLIRVSDLALARLRRTFKVEPTGYQDQPKLIMRSDTDIKQWSQLKGRSVCISEGSSYVGSLHARYGAREQVMKAPADTLLALRVGNCDATVHDAGMLDQMLKLPEWKKFSASLPLAGTMTRLVWVLRPEDDALHRVVVDLMDEWRLNDYWAIARKRWVNDVAFEVYLDQNVPDCH
ncbi:ABC transporter substrate-binding protein [Glaciimonas sp. GG7]